MARVEGAGAAQKVVIESPYHEENDQAGVTVTAATANSITATLFGNTNNNGMVTHSKISSGENFLIKAVIGSGIQGTYRVSKPYMRQLDHY